MATTAPVTIHKSLAGFALLNIIGLSVFAVLTYTALATGLQSLQIMGVIYGTGAGLVALTTAMLGYVYRLSYIQLSDTGIMVVSYSTILVATTASTLYRDIVECNANQTFLQGLLGAATLDIEASGPEQRTMTLPWVSNAQGVATEIIGRVQTARIPVSTT